MKKRYMFWAVFACISTVVFYLTIYNDGPGHIKISKKDLVLSSLESGLQDINAELPKRIDDSTTLSRVYLLNGKLHRQYHLSEGLSKFSFGDNYQLKLTEKLCAENPNQQLLALDIETSNQYFSYDKSFLFEITTSRASCKI